MKEEMRNLELDSVKWRLIWKGNLGLDSEIREMKVYSRSKTVEYYL